MTAYEIISIFIGILTSFLSFFGLIIALLAFLGRDRKHKRIEKAPLLPTSGEASLYER